MAVKKIIKILLVLLVVVVLAILCVSAYVLLNSRQIFLSALEKNLGVKAQVSSLKISLPGSLVIEGFALQDSILIERITIVPSLAGFLSGHVVLNSITLEKPRFKITRNPDDTFDFGIPLSKKQKGAISPQKPQPEKKAYKAGRPLRFYADKIKVDDGTIEFIDNGLASQPPFVGRLTQVNLDVFRQSLFNLFRMQFKGRGNLAAQSGQLIGSAESSGWVDYPAGAMDAKILLSDIQLVYFGPYYKKFIKKDLESGFMVFSSDLKSENNDLKADCHVELNDMAFKEAPQEGFSSGEEKTGTKDLSFLAFSSIFGSEGKAVFDFTVRTKMDKPKFEHVKVKGTFLQPTIKQILSKPPRETVEDFKSIGEEFEAIGKEFKKIFKSK